MNDSDVISFKTPVVRAVPMTYFEAYKSGEPTIYYKDFSMNEFIGEKVASIRNVRSAHYFPIYFGGKISRFFPQNTCNKYRVGSYDFKESDVEYRKIFQLPFCFEKDSFEMLLNFCSDDKNRSDFINENLEMVALDIFMGQIDRGANVLYEFHPNGELHLSPLFDYSMSMYNDVDYATYGYTSDFFRLLRPEDYEKLLIQYSQFEEMLRCYEGVSLVSLIEEMCHERKFNLRHVDMDYYKRFDDSTHKRLEKILR